MKGQMTYLAVFATVISLIMYMTAVYPMLKPIIDDFVASSDDAAVNAVVSIYPFFILLAIVFGFLWYVFPQRQTAPSRY